MAPGAHLAVEPRAKNGDDIPSCAWKFSCSIAPRPTYPRGGLKLEGALATTGLSVAGLCCLDAGQSTGGFTDCLLSMGRGHGGGVDVGQGQLHERLRATMPA